MANALVDQDLFELKALLVNIAIKLSARIESGVKQMLALVTGDGDIVLHYIYGNLKPVIKRIPWFTDTKQSIQDICFDPSATWLLVLTLDSSLYIIPALKIVDEKQKIDCKWSINDLTSFPRTDKTPNATPGKVIWWQTLDCNQNAIVGYDTGDISFVSLTDGQIIGVTNINGPVINLNICQDNNLDSVLLLITGESKQQWRLILEQRSNGYIWPTENNVTYRSFCNDFANISINSSHFNFGNEQRGAKSRLQGLKQLSVEKLTSLKQKLADTRSKSVNLPRTKDSLLSEQKSSSTSDLGFAQTDFNIPTKITNLGETFLQPQYAKNRHLFSGYFSATNLLTIHGVDVNVIPLYVHKLYENCRNILVTDNFFYIIDDSYNTLTVVSSTLSESRLDGDNEFNPESLIASFMLPNNNEIILSIYKLTDITLISERSSDNYNMSRENNLCTLPKSVNDLNIRNPKIDTCILVTNFGVYKVILRCSVVEVFMNLVCKENNFEKAERLALVFGLNLQQLFEHAADLLLSNNKFIQSIVLYKLSRCRLLKSVLKFAVAGHAAELLNYVQTCLSAPNIEMSLPTKIHLSNLAVMSYTEIHLRQCNNSLQRLRNFNQFIEFLSHNDYYDQVLAVNILCQTALWGLMNILLRSRGLVIDVLETICKIIRGSDNLLISKIVDLNEHSLHLCISDSLNIYCILLKLETSKVFFSFVRSKLDIFHIDVLKRLVELLDPGQLVIRPVVFKLFNQFNIRSKTVSTSFDSTIDSMESFDYEDEHLMAFQDMIETLLFVLLTFINRTNKKNSYSTSLMLPVVSDQKQAPENGCLSRKYRTLSTGFGHVALIRNNLVWTWGNTSHGCLGQGPLMTMCQLPQPVLILNNICSDILSVSCGRTHSLALTHFGIYAWGSNIYGQLGLGDLLQSSYPLVIGSLANEQIVDICAGQYHSLALTSNGKLYSWGWGVHGQLGHGSIEDVRTPKIVEFFSDMIVAQIAAGHAHTLVLTSRGIVFAFGSNLFGQLGNGTTFKSNVPQQIFKLPERVVLVNTEYFQNFAVSETNRLYTWGASPQVLRLAAQAQKKAKILQQTNISLHEQDSSSKTLNDQVSMQPLQNNLSDSDIPESLSQKRDGVENVSDSSEFNITDRSEDIHQSESVQIVNGNDTVQKTMSSSFLNTSNNKIDFDSQPHLYPRLVNTSLVQGIIVNIASGCHHAALLTKDGNVYTWGKNLDGQLGTGTRKELILPTPVKINPINFLSGINSPVHQDDENLQDLKCTHIACGAEYTAAIDCNGRLLAWGSNAYGQLGNLPNDEPKGLEGKMVLLRTTKRIIKLPSSVQNVSDTPKEVLNIPSQTISYKSSERKSFVNVNKPHFYSLRNYEQAFIETPRHKIKNVHQNVFGFRTLHFVLETYSGFYDSEKVLKKCLELNNWQAASKISFLNCYFTDSLKYQLSALELLMSKQQNSLLHAQSPSSDIEKNINIADSMKTNTHISNNVANECLSQDKHLQNNKNTNYINIQTSTVSQISFSPSLESIKQFGDEIENQGGCEQMCDELPIEITYDKSNVVNPKESKINQNILNDPDTYRSDDKKLLIRNTVLQYVDSLDHVEVERDSTLLSALNIHNKDIFLEDSNSTILTNTAKLNNSNIITLTNETKMLDLTLHSELSQSQIIEFASHILLFYIEQIQNTDNHILMQNILIKCMDFWLSNNLPIPILESILLKNMSKYFYPLSILLFCKNFNNNFGEAINKNDDSENSQSRKSFMFLKQLSTKFCLQLCSMVLKNVDKSPSKI